MANTTVIKMWRTRFIFVASQLFSIGPVFAPRSLIMLVSANCVKRRREDGKV